MAYSANGVRITSDHAPRSFGRARTSRSSQVAPFSLAIICATTSVSLDVANRTPSLES